MNTKTFMQFFLTIARHRLFVGLLLLHILASYYYISNQDITFDEPYYGEYAKRWLQGKPDRIYLSDDSKSPLVASVGFPELFNKL